MCLFMDVLFHINLLQELSRCSGSRCGCGRLTLLKTEACHDRLEGRGAHLGLATADGGCFRLCKFFHAISLLKRLKSDPEIRVREDSGDRSDRGSVEGISQAR